VFECVLRNSPVLYSAAWPYSLCSAMTFYCFSFTEHFYPDCPLLYGSCVCDSVSGESMSGKDGRGDFGVEGDGVERGIGL